LESAVRDVLSTEFNGHGYLEPGIHRMVKNDIAASFVASELKAPK
jgi:hypothetical protein